MELFELFIGKLRLRGGRRNILLECEQNMIKRVYLEESLVIKQEGPIKLFGFAVLLVFQLIIKIEEDVNSCNGRDFQWV